MRLTSASLFPYKNAGNKQPETNLLILSVLCLIL
ncbi:MAG TPA: hypothetical protein DHV15_01980 [Treponema sp.]|uniref:Uncharacterized protein n=1 Tax=Treponema denticola (strain ATCC 35405 / DSM 14222 / CIP 103919 / JCM 8153 / KCTC 15104) TaxID=243275 RepID=Q73JZ5_TREDE|nr:hypothetical protein TDE_2544 [Treponema denticola ATCC 35405]UTY26730.1 hypothetical protein E4N77_08700 [Treponema denticola]HCY94270.1 hypothetical protein [Treponema sp.]